MVCKIDGHGASNNLYDETFFVFCILDKSEQKPGKSGKNSNKKPFESKIIITRDKILE